MRPLRIVYLGTPEFAVPALRALLASRHEVVALLSQPDRPRGRGQKVHPTPTRIVADEAGVQVLQPARLKDPALHESLRALDLDLGVVAAYGRLIPDAMLEIPRLGMINIHASLLPKYRGAAPVHRAVIAGERETGVSIMRVVRELDAGPVFATAARSIGRDERTPEVERALADLGASLVLEVVERLAAGTAREAPQDDSLATYAPKIERDEGQIDWTLASEQIHNLVRGLQPWPLVTGIIDGLSCRVHRTAIPDRTTTAPPGTIVDAGRELTVACSDGRLLEILELQPEGKRVMSARDFLLGRSVRAGARITSRR